MSFTTVNMQTVGRQRTIRGRKCHVRYANKHCVVEYEERRGELYVTVRTIVDGFGYQSTWRTIAATPNLEVAKMAAQSAYRNRPS